MTPADRRRRPSRAQVGATLAVLVPVAMFTFVGLRQPVEFDGAMNLQVAQNLAYHGEYVRYYDHQPVAGTDEAEPPPHRRPHPPEVQTNGPYIFTAAFGLRVVGQNQLGYHFANLAAVAGIAALIWWLLRSRPVLALIGPTLALLLLPRPFKNGLGGIGELPALVFVLLAFAALAHAVQAEDERTALRATGVAFLAGGLATVTKTYMVGALPALAVGLAAVWWFQRPRLVPLLSRVAAYGVPIVAFELYRLANLGSPGAYRAWWAQQRVAISYQAGVDPTQRGRFEPPSTGFVDRIVDQFDLLAQAARVSSGLLLSTLVVVGLGSVGMAWYVLRRVPDDRPQRAGAALLVMLMTGAGAYLGWWVPFLPARRTFDRRTYPMLLMLALAVLVLLCLLVPHVRARWSRRRTRAPAFWLPASGAVAVVLVAGLWTLDRDVAQSTIRDLRVDSSRLDDVERAADFVREADDDHQFYGAGFFSAPTVSLMADRDFRNLRYVDPCELEPAHDLLVRDQAARVAGGRTPPDVDGTVRYLSVRAVGGVQFWRAAPAQPCGSPPSAPVSADDEQ